MKYIVLPTLKFVWALLLTLIFIIFYGVGGGLFILWYFRLPNKSDFEVKIYDNRLLPYVETEYNDNCLYFPSMFHAIWNIKFKVGTS